MSGNSTTDPDPDLDPDPEPGEDFATRVNIYDFTGKMVVSTYAFGSTNPSFDLSVDSGGFHFAWTSGSGDYEAFYDHTWTCSAAGYDFSLAGLSRTKCSCCVPPADRR